MSHSVGPNGREFGSRLSGLWLRSCEARGHKRGAPVCSCSVYMHDFDDCRRNNPRRRGVVMKEPRGPAFYRATIYRVKRYPRISREKKKKDDAKDRTKKIARGQLCPKSCARAFLFRPHSCVTFLSSLLLFFLCSLVITLPLPRRLPALAEYEQPGSAIAETMPAVFS